MLLRTCAIEISTYSSTSGRVSTVELLACDPPTWWTHPSDATCDVVVVPVIPNLDAVFSSVPMEHMLTPDEIKELSIGIGDEVYSLGLFAEVVNTSRNIPILRHGNISMLPAQQLQTELGFGDVYLIEARSIGGMSGSPVFVRPTGHLPFRKPSWGWWTEQSFWESFTVIGT